MIVAAALATLAGLAAAHMVEDGLVGAMVGGLVALVLVAILHAAGVAGRA